jgi:hypothetical protein
MIGGEPFWRDAAALPQPAPRSPPRFPVLPVIGMAARALAMSPDDILAAAAPPDRARPGAGCLALRALPLHPVSYPEIGRVLGDIHHTSARDLHLNAIYLRMRDPVFRGAREALMRRFHLTEEMLHASS